MANGNGKPDPRRKIKAKSLLKRKHALEKKLSQQEALLSNIHQLMDNLTEAKTSGVSVSQCLRIAYSVDFLNVFASFLGCS